MSPEFKYRGARALVILHEQYLREFVEVWRQFRASGLPLPSTKDPCYSSVQKLLWHVFGAARSYMRWMCEKLDLPDPQIRKAPGEAEIEAESDAYLEHLLERWRLPLVNLTSEVANGPAYESRWGVPYCIDAMLEHAVMHPIRHTFQLRELLAESHNVKNPTETR